MQAMGVMPPLPITTSAPPPAPPPPEKPPPPPHENNQPLFGQPTPVQPPAPQQTPNSGSSNNISIPTGNNQSWPQGMEVSKEPPQHSVNAEALKKLAEEERLFDIQFEKWEEEIQKWKRENVNHPDRQAYNEYEQKFETCRAQLLERRQVMKQKRARLLGQTPAAGKTPTGNMSTAVPPPPQSSNHNLNVQSQNQNSVTGQAGQSLQENSENNYKYSKKLPQNLNNKSSQSYQDNSQFGQYNNMPSHAGYSRSNNKSIDPQDRFESYHPQNTQHQNVQHQNVQLQNVQHQNVQHQNVHNQNAHHQIGQQRNVQIENYSSTNMSNSDFLPGSRSAKGIPGLDLVPDDKTGSHQDVIDITDDRPTTGQLPPDYSTISKGINHILGDEKIMNILSMVRDQGVSNTTSNDQGSYGSNPPSNSNTSNYNAPPNSQWDKNQNPSNQQYKNPPNQQYEEPPPNLLYSQRPPGYPPNQSHESNLQQHNYPPPRRMDNDSENNMTQEPFYDRNSQYPGQNIQPRGPPMKQNMPAPRPLMEGVYRYPESGEFLRAPQTGGPPDNRGPMRSNIPPPRPLMQDMPGHSNDGNNYAGGVHDSRPVSNPMMNQERNERINQGINPVMNQGINRGMNQGLNPGMNQGTNQGMNVGMNQGINKQSLPPSQPVRPKWVEEPLFTPSIIVEYEHKPLRLKGNSILLQLFFEQAQFVLRF